jgi:hypothetical protein
MPWRIEDEFGQFGANFVQAGPLERNRDRRRQPVNGWQNVSGADTADEVIALGGWAVIQG